MGNLKYGIEPTKRSVWNVESGTCSRPWIRPHVTLKLDDVLSVCLSVLCPHIDTYRIMYQFNQQRPSIVREKETELDRKHNHRGSRHRLPSAGHHSLTHSLRVPESQFPPHSVASAEGLGHTIWSMMEPFRPDPRRGRTFANRV